MSAIFFVKNQWRKIWNCKSTVFCHIAKVRWIADLLNKLKLWVSYYVIHSKTVLKRLNPKKLLVQIAIQLKWIRSRRLILIETISKCRSSTIVWAADIGEFDVTIF